MTYFKHLWTNWRVAGHALTDVFAHFIHGLIPCIKIKHHQPVHSVIKQKESEPKTGHWIDYFKCSCCGWELIDDVMQSPNMVAFPYCPNCGVRMEVEHD